VRFLQSLARDARTGGAGFAFRSAGRRIGDVIQALAQRAPLPRRRGTLFIGYVQAGLGLGESLRGLLSAVRTTRAAFAVYPFQRGVEDRLICDFMPERYDTRHRYDIKVIEVATDQMPAVRTIDPRILSGGYNVLRTYWELAAAPEAWRSLLTGIQEIWAPNAFVADAFRPIFDGPIVVMPPCVEPAAGALPDRAALGLDPGVHYFLFTFDYYSHPARKNPAAVLEAFRAAFPAGTERVGLILKSTGSADHYPELRRTFLAAAAADPRIRIIDETWSRAAVLGLLRACDCYVSLHRSEGFGLGMAEALYFERAVIGTGYSGNAEFLTEATGFPVSYTLRPVQDGEYFWSDGQVWAEPDLASAVQAFQAVVRQPEVARQRAGAGARLIRERYSRRAVGTAVKTRLEQIRRRRRERPG
jgi:glycosyltransferase involved in cell wall biosynthesis